MTNMEQNGCKIDVFAGEQRNLNGLLMEVTQSLAQANSVEDVLSGKGIPARQVLRNQLMEHLLSKLKKTNARVEGKVSGVDEEAVPNQSLYRCEEFLWYKVHYDPFTKAKKMKKPQQWNTKEVSSVRLFLQDGINFYLSLLEDLASSSSCTEDEPVKHIVARCFVHLGDLARYSCTDLPSGGPSALRYAVPGLYYMQALELMPKNGLTHSNLAAVLMNVERNTCSAMLHYLAALLCQHQHARILMKPVLEGSLRHYETLLDNNNLLVLGAGTTARSSFQHTLLTVVRSFLHVNCDPLQLQIVCRNFLLHFDKLLREVCGGEHDLISAGKAQCDTLMVQTSVLLGVTYHLLDDARAMTCSVLLASVLLSLLSFTTQACRRAFTSCLSPAAYAALVRPPLQSESTTTSCSERSVERGAAATPSSADARHKSTRRAPRRRRRMPRQPPSRGESSCDEDGAESDCSGTTCSVDYSDALCSSSEDDCPSDQDDDENDSGPDVIIESDSERESKTPDDLSKKIADLGISLPGSTKGSPPGLSALNHLLLLARLDNVGESDPLRPTEDQHHLGSNGSQEMKITAVQGSAPSLLLSAKIVCSWLLSASTAKKGIVWSSDPDCDQPAEQSGLASGASPKSNLPGDAKCNTGYVNGTNGGKQEYRNGKCNASENAVSSARSASDERRKASSRESSFTDRDGCPAINGKAGLKAQSGQVGGRGTGQSSSTDQGVGIMWAALASFCNIISVDLKHLCSEDYSKELPNLMQFLKSIAAAKAYQVDDWSELDNFTLPEDDLLRPVLPDVIAEYLCKEKPRALVGFLLKSLQKLGVQPQKDHVFPELDVNSPVNKKETTLQLLPRSCLNAAELTLIRTMRLRKIVFQLTRFAGCPLEYDGRTRAFYMVSDDATPALPYEGSNEFRQNHDEDVEKFYYVNGSKMNGVLRNKYRERGRYPSRQRSDCRSRGKPRYQDDQKPGRKYRPRRRHHRDRYTHYDDARKSPINEFEQRTTRDRDAINPDSTASGWKVSTGGKSYRQERAGRRTPELTVNNLRSQYPSREGRTSQSVSSLSSVGSFDRANESKNRTFASSANNSCQNSPLLSSDDRNASAGSRNGHFSRDGSLVDRGTPSPVSDDQKRGAVAYHVEGGKGQRSSTGLSGASEEEKTRKRLADQQLLTERWLRHELSTSALSKCGTASPTEKFAYIVPDALCLSHYRPTLTALLKLENAVVVPLQVLSHLDDLKRRMGTARDASRWLDYQVRRTLPGGRLRLQGNAEHRRVPGVNYPGKQHKMPWRWFQILECCHYFARLEYAPESSKPRAVGSMYSDRMEAATSRPGTPKRSDEDDLNYLEHRKPVIMLLTGETREAIGKLPFSLNSLTSSVGAEVHFAGEMQKTLPHPGRRGRT